MEHALKNIAKIFAEEEEAGKSQEKKNGEVAIKEETKTPEKDKDTSDVSMDLDETDKKPEIEKK